MDLDYKIEEMEKSDLDEVTAIEKVSFPSPWSRDIFLRELENSFSFNFVARLPDKGNNKVVGYSVFWIVVDEVHILDLAVKEDFRRHKIGKGLILHCLKVAQEKGCRMAFLEVRDSNAAAKNLYDSLGFEEIGTRKSYYSDGEDAIVMVCKFKVD